MKKTVQDKVMTYMQSLEGETDVQNFTIAEDLQLPEPSVRRATWHLYNQGKLDLTRVRGGAKGYEVAK